MSEITPPNWPIYNVALSTNEIKQTVERGFPEAHLISSQELPKGRSFNNRIYFLKIRFEEEEDGQQHKEVVLKVIGRFFDARKVHNEVASLLLLARYCPEVPAPRVLAWSDDGRRITAIQNGVFAVLSDPNVDEIPLSTKPHPWIMMSKCPGRLLNDDDLAGEHSESIADQLANMMKSWRKNIPPRQEIGNIKLQSAGYTSSHALHGLDTLVADPLLLQTPAENPHTTLQQYYDHVLTDQIYKLETNKIFAYLRQSIVGKLQAFRTNVFPRLSCFTQPALPISGTDSVFTHQDFSPRNVLILFDEAIPDSPPTVTGVLDFEFSGFFPPEEEYLTCLGRQDDDWPKPFMELLLRKLESKGVAVPKIADGYSNSFMTLIQVVKLIEHTAPWWLEDGHVTGKDLVVKLERARAVIEYNMEKLVASIRDG